LQAACLLIIPSSRTAIDRFLSVHEQLIVAHDLTMSIQIKLLADSNIKL